MQVEINDTGRGNRIEIADGVSRTGNLRIVITGNDNYLKIGVGTKLASGLIEIRNHHSAIDIGTSCVIAGTLRLRADATRLMIGDATTMMGAHITLHEAGTIRLGRDCMLSGNILMDVSDMHSILEAETGRRINPPEDIEIGDNCVIGARALVCGDIPAGSLAVGSPARVLRSGITWDRQRLPWR
ncbi:putative lipopolysaccharide biosynthesis O-acetyl transferase WbbJ [Roseovarius sp. A-2]|uniref:acyltransferase n=1 Tax=Roseovarius sp. A-2 TaxID=1570360 RepID=UPI0009C47473|nr:acyltransferase [Roseovarius sp. A-2]GAW37121.1 putative lipopolysaccharide biosynthesis O-acetyl transferase WbbJ [Roseovarius sp. A-2]